MNKAKKPTKAAKSKDLKAKPAKAVKTASKPKAAEAVQKLSVKGLKAQKTKELAAVAKKAAKKDMSKVVASVEISAGPVDEKVTALSQKWSSLYKKSQNMDVVTYDMKKSFEPKTAIEHKTLGWGYILENRNDRLEVLFKDGIRFLISNYKG